MFAQYPKLFIFLSLLILALTLYQLSNKSHSEPVKESATQENHDFIDHPMTQPYQQGKIDSH